MIYEVDNDFIKDYLKGVELKGYDIASVFREACVPLSYYTNTQAKMDGESFARLSNKLIRLSDDMAIGFTADRGFRPELFNDVFIKLFAQSSTLEEGLWEWQNFFNTLYNKDVMSCFDVGDQVLVRGGHGVTGLLAISEFHHVSLIIRFLSWSIGRKIELSHVGFSNASPAYCDVFERVLSCPLSFDQHHHFFMFDKSYLRLPIIRSKSELLAYPAALPSDFFTLYKPESPLIQAVEKTMLDYLASEQKLPTIEQVAQWRQVDVRTLRRQLVAQGVSYRALKDNLRRDLALKWLQHEDITVTTIALELGFAETSTFSRAFKTWTGLSPSEYRVRRISRHQQALSLDCAS